MTESIKKRVLIVDDEPDVLQLLSFFLESSGYDVLSAKDGSEAFKLAQNQNPDLIISDLKMPSMDGIELVKKLTSMKSKIPIIIISGYIEELDLKDIFEIPEVKDIISKPIRPENINQLVKDILDDPNYSRDKSIDNLFKKISIDIISEGHFKGYNRYLRLNPYKYLLISRAGDTFLEKQIDKYSQKGIKFLYIKKDDLNLEIDNQVKFGNTIVKDHNSVTPEQKAHFITTCGRIIHDQIHNEGLNPNLLEDSKSYLSNAIDLVTSKNVNLNLFEILSQQPDFLTAHSVGVAVIAFMIAKEHEIVSKKELNNITLGGFLHDIGKSSLLKETYSTPIYQLKTEEKKNLFAHPILGYELIKRVKVIPEAIKNMVLQHHENLSGKGFPRKLKAENIALYSKIVSLANDFCNLTIKNPRYRLMSPKEAIAALEENKINYDKNILSSLKRVFLFVNS